VDDLPDSSDPIARLTAAVEDETITFVKQGDLLRVDVDYGSDNVDDNYSIVFSDVYWVDGWDADDTPIINMLADNVDLYDTSIA